MIPLQDDQPINIVPIVTIALIVACIFTFVLHRSLGVDTYYYVRLVYGLGMTPASLLHHATLDPRFTLVPSELTPLTSQFLHDGWIHLLTNMLFLYIFGDNVEEAMGHVRFILFYLLCGAIAAVGQALLMPTAIIPLIGASGAVSGVLGAYIMMFPRAQILTFIPFIIPIIRFPAFFILSAWLLWQVINAFMTSSSHGGVAWFAHVGGFVAGMLLVGLFKKKQVAP